MAMNSCGHDLGMMQGRTMIDDEIINNINLDCQYDDKLLVGSCSGFEVYPIEGLLYSKMIVFCYIRSNSNKFRKMYGWMDG